MMPFHLASPMASSGGLAVRDADDRHVDLVADAGLGVVDGAVPDTGGQTAQKVGVGVMQGPVPADLFEMGSQNIADEAATTGLPDPCRAAWAFELSPDRAHDRVVEADQWLGDSVRGPVVAEGVRVTMRASADARGGPTHA
jgi:hypothetical protein